MNASKGLCYQKSDKSWKFSKTIKARDGKLEDFDKSAGRKGVTLEASRTDADARVASSRESGNLIEQLYCIVLIEQFSVGVAESPNTIFLMPPVLLVDEYCIVSIEQFLPS
jgi:hypothetical protein